MPSLTTVLVDNLNENELSMSTYMYNSIFKTKYTVNNYKNFVPHDLKVTFYHDASKVFMSKTFRITSLFVGKNYAENVTESFRISKQLYNEFYDNKIFCFGYHNIYKGNSYDIHEYFTEVLQFYILTNEPGLIFKSIKLIDSFEQVFSYISIFIIISIFLIIILNASTIIKQNIYEIGLMKAFGAKTRELVTIFTLQMIFTSLCVCILLFSMSNILISSANNLLNAGIQAYYSSRVVSDFNLLIFKVDLFSLNIIVITLFTIISTIVPIMAIRAIKPLKIVKNRN